MENQELFHELLKMEFSIETIHKALAAGCEDLPSSVDWICSFTDTSSGLLVLPGLAATSPSSAQTSSAIQPRLVESKHKSDLRGLYSLILSY
jgi:hypothetical protein